MSYIIKIATAVPENGYDQSALMQFYGDSTDDESTKRKIKILAAKSGISTRYSVLKDYGSQVEDFTFFNKNKYLLPTPSLSERMAIYRKEALKLCFLFSPPEYTKDNLGEKFPSKFWDLS